MAAPKDNTGGADGLQEKLVTVNRVAKVVKGGALVRLYRFNGCR